MEDPTPAERRKLQSILDGLALAVRRNDEIDDDSVEKTSAIKIQKFGHRALEAHDELDDVTHSWYIAGAKVAAPKDSFGKERFLETHDRLGRQAGDEGEFVEHPSGYDLSEDAETYASYFVEDFDLDDAWFTNASYFLRDFYEDVAPPEYRELYVAVQNLRIELRRTVGKLVDVVDDGTQANLGDFGQETPVNGPDQYDEIASIVSKIHLELAADEKLQQTLSLYRAFTDVLEDAALALSKRDVSRIDDTQLQAFQTLSRSHYYDAWKLPSLVIAMETARGPRADDLRMEKVGELQTHTDELADEIESIRRTCSEAGLVPAVADYPASNADDELLDELIELYVESP